MNLGFRVTEADHQTGHVSSGVVPSSALQDNLRSTHRLWTRGECGPAGALSCGPQLWPWGSCNCGRADRVKDNKDPVSAENLLPIQPHAYPCIPTLHPHSELFVIYYFFPIFRTPLHPPFISSPVGGGGGRWGSFSTDIVVLQHIDWWPSRKDQVGS